MELITGNNTRIIQEQAYQSVLEQKFVRGFRLSSSIEIRRFKHFFLEINQYTLSDSNEKIIKTISKLGIIYNGKIFCLKTLISQELLTDIKHFIQNSFEIKKNVVYYAAIINHFQTRLLETNIVNEEMLKTILEVTNNNEYIINRSYLTSTECSMEPKTLLRRLMTEQYVPMTIEEIHEKLPQFTTEAIKDLIYNDFDIFSVGNNRFCHIDCIQIIPQELNSVIQFVELTIKKHSFITGTELIKNIQHFQPNIINNNTNLSVSELRYALTKMLKEKFSVNGNIISTPNTPLNVWSIFSKYCESHDEITLNELDDLRNTLSSPTIPIDVVYKYKIRLNENQFIPLKDILWDIEKIDNAIELFCPNDYIPLHAIGKNDYPLLPSVEYPWTDYLLESYIYSISKRFQLYHGSFNTSCCVGAIARRIAKFTTFNELLIDVLAHSEEELTENCALDLFCREGYIARRRLKNIEQIIAQAKIMRKKNKINY